MNFMHLSKESLERLPKIFAQDTYIYLKNTSSIVSSSIPSSLIAKVKNLYLLIILDDAIVLAYFQQQVNYTR